jgi:hypothetical protein
MRRIHKGGQSCLLHCAGEALVWEAAQASCSMHASRVRNGCVSDMGGSHDHGQEFQFFSLMGKPKHTTPVAMSDPATLSWVDLLLKCGLMAAVIVCSMWYITGQPWQRCRAVMLNCAEVHGGVLPGGGAGPAEANVEEGLHWV